MPVRLGLLVTLQAKQGKQDALAEFLREAPSFLASETQTVTWYAVRPNDDTFVIFDTFDDEEGRQAHLSGDFARALGQVADHLLAAPPSVQPVDVVAALTVDAA